MPLENLYVHAKLLPLCPTLCDPMDHSLPGSCVDGILQAILEVCCHALLQGIFPTEGSNPHLLMSPALAGGFFTPNVIPRQLAFKKKKDKET